jgi:hypothetical protein
MRWHFTPQRPDAKIRDPIQGEFFANETIDKPGEALVREGIQNALDASTGRGVVTVRIFVSGESQAVPAKSIAPFLKGIWPHLNAPGNGLLDVPTPDAACPYLVVEDFGTTGLIGDVEQTRPLEGVKNHFFYFFRAEGRTDKGEQDRGRWGVGKYVFPLTSQISSTFGVTVRHDDARRLMMGQSVLKTHPVDPELYSPDGWFGTKTDNKPVLPTDDPQLIDEFSAIFGLQRGNDPGLSVVVPWYQLDMTDTELIRAVIRHYFYPIIKGNLEVLIETPEHQTVLDQRSLTGELDKLGTEFAVQMKSVIDLAQWSASLKAEDIPYLLLPESRRAPSWSSDLIPDETAAQLRTALRDRKRFAIRVPVSIRRRPDVVQSSHFDIFVAPDDSPDKDRPIFVRGGIIISDVKSHRTRGVRALVVIEDAPLATLLGDAENPAHTQWQWGGSHFKDKYFFGKSVIEFVRESVHELLRIVTREETEADPHLLADIFRIPPLPENEETLGREKKPKTKPGPEPPPPPDIPPSPRRFRVQKISGGFKVTRGDDGAKPPAMLHVRAAYDVRRGNPLSRYNPADFEFGKGTVQFEPPPHNAEFVEVTGNSATFRITDPDFTIVATGFDQSRDLFIRVIAREPSNADETS